MDTPLQFEKTPTFEKLMSRILTSKEYDKLCHVLTINPERGDVIPGGGGIRKIRVGAKGRGKSGGARVIYYYIRNESLILFITIYTKNEKETLTDRELATLRTFVKEL
ncbi:MAG: type II toxin-antitoxin system RelE/ParE family toxin [Nitrosospira sp.]|nr:type II toxin-antitoxin system RelE/ParE family toxin [Nitrosospira sp.]